MPELSRPDRKRSAGRGPCAIELRRPVWTRRAAARQRVAAEVPARSPRFSEPVNSLDEQGEVGVELALPLLSILMVFEEG